MPPLPPSSPSTPDADIAVVGTGAAGLYAAIHAGRAAREAGRPLRILAIDGAKKLGAKILVAGGGRCNVTHHAVDETAYAGSSRNAIKKVLRRYDVPQTVAFFRELGVELKREETGKLFPTTDDAHTVLNALVHAADDAGVRLLHPLRIAAVERTEAGFVLVPEPEAAAPPITARRVILATGGKALPRTGSDGHGYTIVGALGHSLTPRIFPALVPLVLAEGHFLRSLSGLTLPATLELRSSTNKRLVSFTNSTLFTHFGLSGPGVLDISRYYTESRLAAPDAPPRLLLSVLPGMTADTLDAELQNLRNRTPLRLLADPPHSLPDRLARALCAHAGLDPTAPGHALTRDRRRALAAAATELPLPVTGDRGFTFAEVTAGGVPLAELHLETMASRVCPGLHLCGEICDVDGRIGGFNFQWAWASGWAAGRGAVEGR